MEVDIIKALALKGYEVHISVLAGGRWNVATDRSVCSAASLSSALSGLVAMLLDGPKA